MVQNTILNSGPGGSIMSSDEIDGIQHLRVKVLSGADGEAVPASPTNPLPTGTYGADQDAAQRQILTDAAGRQIAALDEIRLLLAAILTRTPYPDGSGFGRVATHPVSQSGTWNVTSFPAVGPSLTLDQVYASHAAYGALRAKITVT